MFYLFTLCFHNGLKVIVYDTIEYLIEEVSVLYNYKYTSLFTVH